jgi:hypothetical protein
MRPNGNTIQATILLDSGAFLTDEEKNGFTYSKVGYFAPHIYVYVDGEQKEELHPEKDKTGALNIDVRKYDAAGKEMASSIELSDCLLKYLLRLHNIYGEVVEIDEDKYDCIFHFNSGHFCSSKLKTRNFRLYDGYTDEATDQKKPAGLIAHDIAIHYELAPGETLRLVSDGAPIWSSGNHDPIARRLEVEILADSASSEMFYRDSLKLSGRSYWMPNQGGDPPPNWVHGGPAGGGAD